MNAPSRSLSPPSQDTIYKLTVFGLPAAFAVCLLLIPLEIGDLFGLPAHPLLLHLPVVLIPVLAIATVALMIRPTWRERYGLAIALVALLALAATVLTVGAGHAFKEAREAMFSGAGFSGGPTGENSGLALHEELGDQLRIIMFVFVGLIVAAVVVDTFRRHEAASDRGRTVARLGSGAAFRVGLSILAVVALVWVVRTGHEGAKLAWGQQDFPAGQGQFPGGSGAPSGGGKATEGQAGGGVSELFGEKE